ncbi:MAG: hypothetical protein PWP27_1244 [Clostridiales bacterium]|jgi:putative sporulation protein YyaC|nr:hypothetical protein [Clostridiales bacterium]MDK2933434.1 hypothetical protein [Clostridiales bacterium]
MINNLENTIYIDSKHPCAFSQFTSAVSIFFNENPLSLYDSIIIVCIGTDRSTGDSLGPLVGEKLNKLINLKFFKSVDVHVLGTLEHPVHAKNLEKNLQYIKTNYHHPFIIAVDACLGKMDHIGYICVSNKPIKPGAGVSKNLPEIGDVSIAGIVNFSGFMDFLVLQNTRLSLVMKMADLIASGLRYILWKKNNNRLKSSPQKDKIQIQI